MSTLSTSKSKVIRMSADFSRLNLHNLNSGILKISLVKQNMVFLCFSSISKSQWFCVQLQCCTGYPTQLAMPAQITPGGPATEVSTGDADNGYSPQSCPHPVSIHPGGITLSFLCYWKAAKKKGISRLKIHHSANISQAQGHHGASYDLHTSCHHMLRQISQMKTPLIKTFKLSARDQVMPSGKALMYII